MTVQRARLIFNPNAGSLAWSGIIDTFSTFWRARGWVVSLTPTERPGHAIELASEAAEQGIGLVFAAGGDGTMHEVANGLAHSQTIMAPLPVGTANILAKELAIPTPSVLRPDWWTQMLVTLANGRVQEMDLGLNDSGRHWMLWASTGVDGFVIDQIEPRTPKAKRFGMVGYAAKVAWLIPTFKGISGQVTVDDRVVSGDFLMVNVSNCRRYGAGDFNLNRGGVLDDGLFEVLILRGRSWPMLLRYSIMIGLGGHAFDPNIERIQARRVNIETVSPAPYHLDAEPAGLTPLACAIQPGALRILVPNTAPAGLFEKPGVALVDC